ncbi:MAG: tRNA lysidine(34) synthetase TilS [Sideroxydans sp.]|nr:tRNA lysidine(34) synthetase TilS [Sideroxydans sp.]
MSSVNLLERVAQQLTSLVPPHSRLLIALSGGVDSVVLLHLVQQLKTRFDWQLHAVHVHHQISLHADSWADFCAQLCADYGIPFHLEHIDITPLQGLGIEAAARQLRYQALAKHASGFLLLAHHADDQAETLLLQLLRGTGVKGAAAMPLLAQRECAWLRPLLNVTRVEIVDYARAQNLAWIEDDSNTDTRYARNFLRLNVMPVLAEKFPAYRQTLSRSAQHFAEAASLLDELAALDAASSMVGKTLSLSALQALSASRAKNLLRYFLQQRGAAMPHAVQLEELLMQLLTARDDARVCVSFAGWQVRRYQGAVYAQPALPDCSEPLCLPWQNEAAIVWLPLNTQIHFLAAHGQGISLAKLSHAPVTLRLRLGGETLRPAAKAAMRTLKNLLQEQGVPPWLRSRLPLLYCGEELVCVAGLIAANFQAEADEAGVDMQLTL